MKPRTCARCGAEIETGIVTFRGRDFCGDECCESFEEALALKAGPDETELDAAIDPDLDDDFDEDFDEDDFDDDELDDEDDLDLDDDDYGLRYPGR